MPPVLSQEAAYRSVKARNLRRGHKIHNAGTVTDVATIPGSLHGERVRASLDSGDTMTYDPEERVSVTSTVQESVEQAVAESIQEANLRDTAATRERWRKWEMQHGWKEGGGISTHHGGFRSGNHGVVHIADRDKARGKPGIVERPATGDLHVQSKVPKGAMVKGNKVYLKGDAGHKPEEYYARGESPPTNKVPKGFKTPLQKKREQDKADEAAKYKADVAKEGMKPGQERLETSLVRTHPDDYTEGKATKLFKMAGHEGKDPKNKQHIMDAQRELRQRRLRRGTSVNKNYTQEADVSAIEEAVIAALGGEQQQVQEAADSLIKASTPEPFSTSKTSNWVARVGGLPAYIQHIAHDLMEKRGKSESNAIQMAIGIVKRWARGGGKVDDNTRAAAAKAVAEWEAKKARSHVQQAAIELSVLEAMWQEDDPELLEAAAIYEAETELRASWLVPIQEAETAVDTEGDRSDGLKVKCPKCNTRAVPKSGKCPKCGHDVSKLAAFAKRLKGKVSEAEETGQHAVMEAVREGLEDELA